MTNKTKIFLLMAALGTGVAAVFTVVQALTGDAWAVSILAAAVAALAARSIYWRSIGSMMNDGAVVATDHGPEGRLEAIEVFWRPG